MQISEIKELILWCKKNKVKSFNKDGISFELSDLAFIEDLNVQTEESQKALKAEEVFTDSFKTFAESEETDEQEQEDLLFWSSNK